MHLQVILATYKLLRRHVAVGQLVCIFKCVSFQLREKMETIREKRKQHKKLR